MTSSKRHVVVSVVTRFIVCGLILAVGVGVAGELIRTRPTPAIVDEASAPPRIAVMEVANAMLGERFAGYGTLKAVKQVDIPTRVSGVVLEIPKAVQVGASLQEGELLVQLDPTDYAQRVEMGRAALAIDDAASARLDVEEALASDRFKLAQRDEQLAVADLDRAREASSGGAVTSREVDQIESRLLQAKHALITQREIIERLPILREELTQKRKNDEAALRLAELAVERCSIISPITGVLAWMELEEGESLGAGQPVASIVEPTRLEVPLHVAASARGQLRVGDKISISHPASTQRVTTTVQRISPTDDPATRTMVIYAEVDGTANGFAPGLFVRGEIESMNEMLRTVVPRRAVRNQRVLVVEDGIVKTRNVESGFSIWAARPETGIKDMEWVVLSKALPEGTLVVVDGSRSLPVGTLVEASLAMEQPLDGSQQ